MALVSVIPAHDLGVAIVLLTLVVKFLLTPVAHKSIQAQGAMRELQPKLDKIKSETKESQEEQARRIMALYKEHGVNPFSSFVLLLIQLPIIFALYFVSSSGLSIDPTVLYSFVPAPEVINKLFLGLIDVSIASPILAVLTGITQFFQAHLSVPPTQTSSDFARGMQLQIKYVLPVMVTLISFNLAAAVVLYWLTSNVFAICHELSVKRLALRAIVK